MSNNEKFLDVGEVRVVDSEEYKAAVAVIDDSMTAEYMLGATKDTFKEQPSTTIFITRNLATPHGLKIELKTDDDVVFAIAESRVLGAFRHTAIEELQLHVKSTVTPAERSVMRYVQPSVKALNCELKSLYRDPSFITHESYYDDILRELLISNRKRINDLVSADKRVDVKTVLEKQSEEIKERKAELISKGGLLSKLMKGVR